MRGCAVFRRFQINKSEFLFQCFREEKCVQREVKLISSCSECVGVGNFGSSSVRGRS